MSKFTLSKEIKNDAYPSEELNRLQKKYKEMEFTMKSGYSEHRNEVYKSWYRHVESPSEIALSIAGKGNITWPSFMF